MSDNMCLGVTERLKPILAEVRDMVRNDILPIEEQWHHETANAEEALHVRQWLFHIIEVETDLKYCGQSEDIHQKALEMIVANNSNAITVNNRASMIGGFIGNIFGTICNKHGAPKAQGQIVDVVYSLYSCFNFFSITKMQKDK